MRKKLVSVRECKDGDIAAQDVFSESGILYVTENTRLNTYIIEKLKSLNIEKLHVYYDIPLQSPSEYELSYRKFLDNYNNNTEVVKEMISSLATGKKPEAEHVESITETMFEGIKDKGNIIRCLSEMRNFDQYTYNHSLNVALYSMLIASWLKLPDETIKDAMKAGLLHDIGKAKIPEEILNKDGTLSDEEFEIMKEHPTHSYNVARTIPGLSKNVLKGILFHHEREDGSGYPMALTGDRIDKLAKIVAIADVYDALISERAYKKRITPFDTFKIFQNSGLGHFDAEIMMVFLANIASYYIGAGVVFESGKRGRVAAVLPHNISNPIVNVEGNFIDLDKNKDVKIIDMAG